jgi:hypothetical protein
VTPLFQAYLHIIFLSYQAFLAYNPKEFLGVITDSSSTHANHDVWLINSSASFHMCNTMFFPIIVIMLKNSYNVIMKLVIML